MSEYQFYEFRAIDRPLDDRAMAELRACSSRARISPTGFVNVYNYGSFKGDEDDWIERHFDAFLYLANWGTRIVKLGLPTAAVDVADLQAYCDGANVSLRERGDRVVLTFEYRDDPPDGWVEGDGLLDAILPVRAALLRGDRRALYLGWLLHAQEGESESPELEPPVPPGLASLTPALAAFAEFLCIDTDLLHVAAEASAPLDSEEPSRAELCAWLAALPAAEKDDWLAAFILAPDPALAATLYQRFARCRREAAPAGSAPHRRTAAQLWQLAEAHAALRRRLEAERRAAEAARIERAAAAKLEARLAALRARIPAAWRTVDDLIATKQTKAYDEAVRLLTDLRELAARGQLPDFAARLAALREAHARKPGLLSRLQQARLG